MSVFGYLSAKNARRAAVCTLMLAAKAVQVVSETAMNVVDETSLSSSSSTGGGHHPSPWENVVLIGKGTALMVGACLVMCSIGAVCYASMRRNSSLADTFVAAEVAKDCAPIAIECCAQGIGACAQIACAGF